MSGGYDNKSFCDAVLVSCLLSGLVYANSERSEMPALDGRDLQGKKVSLGDLKGNVVVVSFWATWCVPCKRELTDLNSVLEKRKKEGFRVLAVSMDGPETMADIRGVVRRHKWKMTVLHDQDGSVTSVHNPRGAAPFTIYVDRCGKMYASHEGYTQGDRGHMEKRVSMLLRERKCSGGSE